MSTVLQQMHKTGKVPHSLLLIGSDLKSALDFSKILFGSDHEGKIDSGNHPDLHIYEPEEKSNRHSIASMQKLIREMAFPPFEAPRKIFIIDQAEKMLPSSSNALLKTLEEPANDAYILLLSNQPDALLPTILSRLHPVQFKTLSPKEPIDLTLYFEMAQNGQYAELLDQLPNLEAEDPQALFAGCLSWAAKQPDPQVFIKYSTLVGKSQIALKHNLKLRTVLLNLFNFI